MFQRAWDKYGEAAFAFRVLERVSRCEDLIRREQFYIDSLHGYTEGLNSRPKAESNLGRIAGPVSEETKAKISRANKIAYKGRQGPMSLGSKHTEDAKKAMSLTKRKTGAKITFNGRSLCLSDWADAVGITLRGLGNRLHRGWPLHRALSERSRGY